MTDCYIYARVSSKKQVNEGTGLESQIIRCMNYAKENGYKVIKTFQEKGVSGQLKYRPELEKLLSELKKNKNEKILLVDSASRLSRSLENSIFYKVRLSKLNTKFVTADMNIPDDINGELLFNLVSSVNQHAAQSNQIRVHHRMHACMENGRYILNTPFGYERYNDPKLGKIIRPDGNNSIIAKELLERFASNDLETIADVQKCLLKRLPAKSNNYTYRNKQASNILKKSALYAGLIIYEKQDDRISEKKWSINTIGKHKPIISLEIHNKVQRKLKNPRKIYKTNNTDKFPLRGNLKCNGCGGNMTSNFSKSKSGNYIGYYRCNSYDCDYEKKNINKDLVEEIYLSYLKSISLDNDFIDTINDVTKLVLQEINQISKYEKIKINKKIKDLQNNIDSLIEKLSQDKFINIQEEIASSITTKKEEIIKLKSDLDHLKNDTSFDQILPDIIRLFEDLSGHWSSLNPKSKKNINNLLFPDGIKFTLDQKITTPKLAMPFNIFQRNYDDKSNLVEPRGIEPLTSTLPA